jgi:hypothetical protein
MKCVFRFTLTLCALLFLLAGAPQAHAFGLCERILHWGSHGKGGSQGLTSGGGAEKQAAADQRSDGAAAPQRTPEKIGPPRASEPGPSAASGTTSTVKIDRTKDAVEQAIADWAAVGTTIKGAGGTGHTITILVDGKTIYEIKGGGGDGGPVTKPTDGSADADLKKALQDALATDGKKAGVDVKKGVTELQNIYGNLANLVDTGAASTLSFVLTRRDQFIGLNPNAKQLDATNAAIKSWLDTQLKGIDQGTAMSKTDLGKVSSALRTVAASLNGLP